MAKLSLKNILNKNNDNLQIIKALSGQLNDNVIIEDSAGRLLFSYSDKSDNSLFNVPEFPVEFNGEKLGSVKGSDKGAIIADLLVNLVSAESERKKLGSEVLNLYQEINLIFNFSEKLAQTLGAKAIAEITLDEANHVLHSDCGVVVLWNAEKNLLEVEASTHTDFFDQENINRQLSLLLHIILTGHSEIVSDITSLQKNAIVPSEFRSIIYSALKVKRRIMGAIILGSKEADHYTAGSLKLLTTLALQSSSAIESSLLYEKSIREAEEREAAMKKIFNTTEKFVPYQFINSLGHEVITDVKLGDQVEKIVTVLFTDIRNYTSISEKMTPEETFTFVCHLNERMGPIIRRHHGFINQYLGDSIMAIFPQSATDALSAAIEMQNAMTGFNNDRLKNDQPTVQIGVGMHTGPLIMGITGDHDRLDACTISDTVNTASRVESLTKHYKAPILLSGESLGHIREKNNFHIRNLGFVQLKGKLSSLNIYECFDCNTQDEIQKKTETQDFFDEGVSNYTNQLFRIACDSFRKVIELNKDDKTAMFFYNYIRQIIDSGIPENNPGVVKMQEK